MPQDRLFRAGSPVPASLPGSDTDAWRLAAKRRMRVGTASWTDRTLIDSDAFYPAELRTPADRLRYYADQFPIVEVDATYYGLPSERNSKAWVERTPAGFVFNVKAYSLLTQHPTRPSSLPKDLRETLGEEARAKRNVYQRDVGRVVIDECWQRFCGALRPLADAGRLAAVLFQFPEWFTPSRASRDYVVDCKRRLAERLPDAWCAVEFRNRAWMSADEQRERTLGFLSEHLLPFVAVDMPQGFTTSIPPVAAATAPLALVRFHGRNAEAWGRRGVSVQERFRYDYDGTELSEWTTRIERLREKADEVHVLMNNCYADYSVRAARAMAQLLLAD